MAQRQKKGETEREERKNKSTAEQKTGEALVDSDSDERVVQQHSSPKLREHLAAPSLAFPTVAAKLEQSLFLRRWIQKHKSNNDSTHHGAS